MYARVHTYGAWSWGSRYLPPILMYMFEVEFVARQLIKHGGFFAHDPRLASSPCND